MDLKECLTNEKIRKKFVNQFELVNYAIKLAENMILSGRDPRVKIDSQNRALQVLSEILNNKDKFDDIFVEAVVDAKSVSSDPSYDESFAEKAGSKNSERKKSSKASAKF